MIQRHNKIQTNFMPLIVFFLNHRIKMSDDRMDCFKYAYEIPVKTFF